MKQLKRGNLFVQREDQEIICIFCNIIIILYIIILLDLDLYIFLFFDIFVFLFFDIYFSLFVWGHIYVKVFGLNSSIFVVV